MDTTRASAAAGCSSRLFCPPCSSPGVASRHCCRSSAYLSSVRRPCPSKCALRSASASAVNKNGCLRLLPSFPATVMRAAQTENAFVDVQLEEEEEEPQASWDGETEEEDDDGGGSRAPEDFGEVDAILASRVTDDRKTEYLILWKDDHPDSWEPAGNIAAGVVDEYEKPWWQAARKGDAEKLQELLDSEDLQRDVNAVDENERTALLFAAGLGSEKCARLLVEYGADVHWQDKDGYTALHIASGYVHVNTVKALVELGADPDLEDEKGRSALSLAQELLARTPRANPLQFARRMALDQVVKALDDVMFETVEVEQILDKRTGDGGVVEYLVKWTDDSPNGWVVARDVGEDLIKDYEEGLEYGIVERVLDRRETDGKIQYFVKWSDGKETWETQENVGDEIVAEYNSSQSSRDPSESHSSPETSDSSRDISSGHD